MELKRREAFTGTILAAVFEVWRYPALAGAKNVLLPMFRDPET